MCAGWFFAHGYTVYITYSKWAKNKNKQLTGKHDSGGCTLVSSIKLVNKWLKYCIVIVEKKISMFCLLFYLLIIYTVPYSVLSFLSRLLIYFLSNHTIFPTVLLIWYSICECFANGVASLPHFWSDMAYVNVLLTVLPASPTPDLSICECVANCIASLPHSWSVHMWMFC